MNLRLLAWIGCVTISPAARSADCSRACSDAVKDENGCCPAAPAPAPAAPRPTTPAAPRTSSTRYTAKNGLAFVKIPAGSFTMGSAAAEAGRDDDEVQHPVTLSRAFWMSTTEVTQAQFEQVMGFNPSKTGTNFYGGKEQGSCAAAGSLSLVAPSYPVMCVSWQDAVEMANALSAVEGLRPAYSGSGACVTWDRTANGYRLPTEAEWEYAARAGTSTAWGGPSSSEQAVCVLGNVLDQSAQAAGFQGTFAPCDDGSPGLGAVGRYRANPWGLHDTVGKVWERTWDVAGAYEAAATDPAGPDTGSYRVSRGGSWGLTAGNARVANRGRYPPEDRYDDLGFRLARSIPRRLIP